MGSCACAAASDAAREREFRSRYVLGDKIGCGAFGQVRLANESGGRSRGEAKRTFAVKIVDARAGSRSGSSAQKPKRLDSEVLKLMSNEVGCWTRIGHQEHCVQLFEAFCFHGRAFLVMELCQDTVLQRLEKLPGMQETDLANIFRQMALGISAVHEASVVHRDIKPDNFMWGGEDGETLKLCDFGLACRVGKSGKLFGEYGTPPYMSPEMVSLHGQHSYPTDVWSFGATAYLMLYGEFPHMPTPCTPAFMKRAIRTGSPAPRYCRGSRGSRQPSEVAAAFVEAMLQRDAGARPIAKNIPFMPLIAEAHKAPAVDEEATLPPAAEEHSEEGELIEVVRRARKNTHQFKRPVDPTVQRTLDEVLQQYWEGENPYCRSVSDGDKNGTKRTTSLSGRSNSRLSTHTGIILRHKAWEDATPSPPTRAPASFVREDTDSTGTPDTPCILVMAGEADEVHPI